MEKEWKDTREKPVMIDNESLINYHSILYLISRQSSAVYYKRDAGFGWVGDFSSLL
jgi:hypothetical protein